tara:strand:+ start:6541 stop:7473 length:933 start_codon:yes stop_codon:yes gene_type:complete
VHTHKINLESKIEGHFFHLAIGNFDGIHLGHQQIINSLVKEAKELNKPSAILSFHPHPRQFFSRELDRYQIISDEKKQSIFADLGVNDYFCLKFDELLSNLSPIDFIKKIIIEQLNVEKLIVGYDFRFGKDRKGDKNLLLECSKIYGFNIKIIEPINNIKTNKPYSSTAIREGIRKGKMDEVNLLLGRPWSMGGVVIHGDKRARKMNFPTANILPHDQIYPLKGVYTVNVKFENNTIRGIANFGIRPTVSGEKLLLEVHLFDFNRDIYGNYLTVEFLAFIRGEKKFENFDYLIMQINKDIQIAKDYHKKK